jgi:hypothetical protein
MGSGDFKKGFWIGLGVMGAVVAVGFVSGVIGKL